MDRSLGNHKFAARVEVIINVLMNVFGIQEKVSCFCLFAN